MNDDTDTHITTQKTLWSDTLVELLIIALKKASKDDQVISVLKDMKAKSFDAKYITSKVRKELDEKAVDRVKLLMRKI